MSKFQLFSLMLLVSISISGICQQKPGEISIPDSVLSIVDEKDITEMYNTYIDDNIYHDRSKSLVAAWEYLEYAKQNGLNSEVAFAYTALGRIAHFNSEYRKAINFYHNADSIFAKEKQIKQQVALARNIALSYGYLNEEEKELHAYRECLRLAKEINDTLYIAFSKSGIAAVYQKWNAFNISMELYNEALEHFEQIGANNRRSNIYYNIGIILKDNGRLSKAIEFFILAFETSESLFVKGNSQTAIASCYIEMHQPDSALIYLSSADEFYQKSSDKIGALYLNINSAEAYLLKMEVDSALLYLEKAKKLAVETEHFRGQLMTEYVYGKILLHTSETVKGIKIIEQTLNKTVSSEFYELQKTMLEELMQYYEKNKSFENAYNYYKALNLLQDSLYNKRDEKLLYDVYVRYKTKETILENENLKKDIRIRKLRTILQGIVFLFTILIISLYFFYKIKNKKASNEKLSKLNQINETHKNELLEINETKDKFFAIISHDLRNPMGNIENFAELILKNFDSYPSEKIRNFISIIHQSSATASALLVNLLEWSRLQRGVINHEPEEVSLKVVFMQVESLFNSIFEVKNVTLEIEEENNLRVIADKNMLITVLRNLVSNAVKFTPSNGSVKVYTALLANGMVEIFVEDNGRGMDAEQRENLFSSRVESTKGTNNESGTGIGLLLVKEFVELNKGTLHIQSEIGLGSTFSFTVPGVS